MRHRSYSSFVAAVNSVSATLSIVFPLRSIWSVNGASAANTVKRFCRSESLADVNTSPISRRKCGGRASKIFFMSITNERTN